MNDQNRYVILLLVGALVCLIVWWAFAYLGRVP